MGKQNWKGIHGKGYFQKRVSPSAPHIVRETVMDPDCRAWLAATATALPRPGMAEDLRAEMPTTLRTLVQMSKAQQPVLPKAG